MEKELAAEYDVIILGAGLGGIAMAARLKLAGMDNFVVLEQAESVGGTWRDNIYPGAACDTESHLYCFEFALHLEVSRMYARQPELLAYAERIVADNKLARHILYRHMITSASWDEEKARWQVEIDGRDPLTARVFIPAWGQLNRPQIPEFEGRESFKGLSFHSARWPDTLDLAGKRVASIGNAASAVQYIPAIAPEVGHLTIFQRSPNWIVPRLDRPFTEEELASYAANPELFRADRDELFAWRETTFERMREGSDEAREVEQIAREHLAAQVHDPELRARLTPDFPLGCKRVLRSDDYLPVLNRDNVELVTEPIARIEPDGITTADGVLHSCDVIIFGTGFETQSFQGPVEVRGIDGVSLRNCWAEGARAYLGMAVPEFPNLFLIYGPNTNLGHNSVLSMIEAQARYIVQAVERLKGFGSTASLTVRADTAAAFDAALQEEMTGSAWTGGCRSWYKNAAGRVVNNWSGPVARYIDCTAQLNLEDYRVVAESRV